MVVVRELATIIFLSLRQIISKCHRKAVALVSRRHLIVNPEEVTIVEAVVAVVVGANVVAVEVMEMEAATRTTTAKAVMAEQAEIWLPRKIPSLYLAWILQPLKWISRHILELLE